MRELPLHLCEMDSVLRHADGSLSSLEPVLEVHLRVGVAGPEVHPASFRALAAYPLLAWEGNPLAVDAAVSTPTAAVGSTA